MAAIESIRSHLRTPDVLNTPPPTPSDHDVDAYVYPRFPCASANAQSCFCACGDQDGVVEVAPFDYKSIEMFYLQAKKVTFVHACVCTAEVL